MTHNGMELHGLKTQAATPRRWGSGCPLKKRALPERVVSTPFLGVSKDKSGAALCQNIDCPLRRKTVYRQE
jgi:hypothetical protein